LLNWGHSRFRYLNVSRCRHVNGSVSHPSLVRDADVQYDGNENAEYEGEFSTHPIVDAITAVGSRVKVSSLWIASISVNDIEYKAMSDPGAEFPVVSSRLINLGNHEVVVVVVVEMNIIKVALSHFCCRTTVQYRTTVQVAGKVTCEVFWSYNKCPAC